MNNNIARKNVVAGLDLSLRGAGVAVIGLDGSVSAATFGYPLSKESTDRDRLERILKVTSQLMAFLKLHKVNYIGVENYAFSKMNSISCQAELGGVVKSQIYVSMKIVPITMPVTSVRKFVLGKSTKSKVTVQKHFKALGYILKTADEYDALAVAYLTDFWANDRNCGGNKYHSELLDRLDLQSSKSIQSR